MQVNAPCGTREVSIDMSSALQRTFSHLVTANSDVPDAFPSLLTTSQRHGTRQTELTLASGGPITSVNHSTKHSQRLLVIPTQRYTTSCRQCSWSKPPQKAKLHHTTKEDSHQPGGSDVWRRMPACRGLSETSFYENPY